MHSNETALSSATAARFALLALNCVSREYPNHILHLMTGPEDVGTPRQLTPAFYGCFDWHSAVHGHWTLVRLLRQFPDADWVTAAVDVLDQHLSDERIAGEVKYVGHPERNGFERPYGLAWLLQLAAECHEVSRLDHEYAARAKHWIQALQPLAHLAVDRLYEWLPKLLQPIRSGEHSQTAFALGLAYDHTMQVGQTDVANIFREQGLRLFQADQNAPLNYEPGGHDFVSPALGTADLLRRFLSPTEFANWLTDFLPNFTGEATQAFPLQPVTPADRSDGKIAHLDGLNLSRAWMLRGIASGLPLDDQRRFPLRQSAEDHASVGLTAVTGEHYAGGHWLGTFATYLLTGRGIPGTP